MGISQNDSGQIGVQELRKEFFLFKNLLMYALILMLVRTARMSLGMNWMFG